MNFLLPSVLSPSPRSRETLLLIQTSLATPWMAFLQATLLASSGTVVCVCVLHPPATVVPPNVPPERLEVINWTGCVPGYEIGQIDLGREKLSKAVQHAVDDAPAGPVHLVIDSPDTLCEDVGSTARAYNILKTWHSAVARRPPSSRLILPLSSRSQLLPQLLTPSFAPSIAHLTLHPPSLLLHLSKEYLTLPPPHSSPAKFWPVFSGLAARGEAEKLVWGADGEGWSNELIVEVLIRNTGATEGRKRAIERGLEGWRSTGACELQGLNALKGMWGRNVQSQQISSAPADPTLNLPFNLSLTEAQQRSRAQVPLPYAHEGQPKEDTRQLGATAGTGAIFYDPDSADDIDDEDPDEDLDI